ncbi:MAG: glycosyltransferase [Candidatus Paceibacterota bacterium]|jgi:glycosyltransferase involved in cell wall biosynthesis
MNKKVSVTIPCFNQAVLFEKEIEYLKTQTLKDFDIIVLDNNSDQDYKKIVAKFPEEDITYTRNQTNIGLMRNLFKSIFYTTDAPYIISLHEDDNLHPQYLEKALDILEKNKDIAFVATLAEWFKNDKELEEKFAKRKNLENSVVLDRTDFVRNIIDGKHIMFGSVVYRRSIFNQNFNLEKILSEYDIFADRPFLVSLLKDGLRAGIILDKGMFVRDHGENDKRAQITTDKHAFNMMSLYKNNLPKPIDKTDYKNFITFSTNNLLNTYSSVQNKNTNFYKFIKEGIKLNLINFKYINKVGVLGILKSIFGKKFINKLVKIIKK